MPEPKPKNRPLVLVVEDEGLVRMTLVDVLEDAGFKVIEAVHADCLAAPPVHQCRQWDCIASQIPAEPPFRQTRFRARS